MSTLIVLHGVRTVQLSQGKNALVDEADWGLVGEHRWHAEHPDPGHWYARGPIRIGRLRLHAFLVGRARGMHVDHRNGDGFDNRRDNLRLCTVRQNVANQRRCSSKSGYKGVVRGSKNRWDSRIMVDRKTLYLGSFRTPQDAARAYDAAALEYFGEFACTNAQLFGDL